MLFQIGQKVMCVDAKNYEEWLTYKDVYIVSAITPEKRQSGTRIQVRGCDYWLNSSRFKIIKDLDNA